MMITMSAPMPMYMSAPPMPSPFPANYPSAHRLTLNGG